jgi:hypothetical protein
VELDLDRGWIKLERIVEEACRSRIDCLACGLPCLYQQPGVLEANIDRLFCKR